MTLALWDWILFYHDDCFFLGIFSFFSLSPHWEGMCAGCIYDWIGGLIQKEAEGLKVGVDGSMSTYAIYHHITH